MAAAALQRTVDEYFSDASSSDDEKKRKGKKHKKNVKSGSTTDVKNAILEQAMKTRDGKDKANNTNYDSDTSQSNSSVGEDRKNEKKTVNKTKKNKKEEGGAKHHEKPEKSMTEPQPKENVNGKDNEMLEKTGEREEKVTNTNYDSDTSHSMSSDDEDQKKVNKKTVNKTKNEKKEEDWIKHHKKLKQSMIEPRLIEGVSNKDIQMLKNAIHDAEESDMQKNNKHLVAAKHTQRVLEQRNRLLTAVKSKDRKAIEKQVNVIKSNINYYVTYYSGIQREVYEAECLLDSMERARKKEDNMAFAMNRNTLSAIRNFKKPPHEVHSVMQGAFLLLGHDLDQTSDWNYITSLCNTETLKRIMNFDVSRLHKDIAATAQQVFRQQNLDNLQSISQAAATFYVWGMGTADECQQLNGNGKVVGIKRQKEIFGMESGLKPETPSTAGGKKEQHSATGRGQQNKGKTASSKKTVHK